MRFLLPGRAFARGRLSLRGQLLVALGACAAVPVLLLGVVQSGARLDAEKARADRETTLAASVVAREIALMMNARADVLRALALDLGERSDLGRADVEEVTARYLRQFPGFYVLLATDPSGVTLGAAPPKRGDGASVAGTTYGDRAYFAKLVAGQEFVASDVVVSRVTGRKAVILAARIRDARGRFVGVAIGGVDLAFLEQAVGHVTGTAPGVGSAVFDSNGAVVVSAGTEGFGSELERESAAYAYGARSAPGSKRLLRGATARVDAASLRWSTASFLPERAVRERAIGMFAATSGVMLGAVLLGLGVAVVLARWIARPVTGLVGAFEAIGAGDLRVKPAALQGFLPLELAQLDAAVSTMLARLRGLVTEVRRTADAAAVVSKELLGASTHMVIDSQTQAEAVGSSSASIVQMTDSLGAIGDSVLDLSGRAGGAGESIVRFDRQIERIGRLLGQVSDAAERTSGGIDDMAGEVGGVASSAERLRQNVEHTTAVLNELSSSIRDVSESAERGQALARDASSLAAAGRLAVEETIGATREINTSFSRVGAAVNNLADRSEAIGEVARVIDEVTRATHLLSINASIIASQAGEHGKSFAIVAERIKSVASETEASTQRITELVGAVQANIGEAVRAVEHGRNTVHAGEARSAEAGRRLKLIGESSGQADRTVSEITEATHDQAERVRDVHRALEQLAAASQQIDRAIGNQRDAQARTEAAMHDLKGLCADARESTDNQRVESHLMAEAVRAMVQQVNAITLATRAQADDRNRIQSSLGVFEDASSTGVERARAIERAVKTLDARLSKLEGAVRSFRID
jgi:methyl-accepting chemotaxis protein